jgi:hypothetical protein
MDMAFAQGRSGDEMIELVRQQWEKQEPLPAVSKWKALYTSAFAEKYSLPADNISENLPLGVDYMEMDVEYFNGNNKACMLNLLVKEPHDLAAYSNNNKTHAWAKSFNNSRQLTHFVTKKIPLKQIQTVDTASVDYDGKSRGFRATTTGFFGANYLPGYDYFSADMDCARQNSYLKENRYTIEDFAVRLAKASIWGKYEPKLSPGDPDYPNGEAFVKSYVSISNPKEIIRFIYE